MKIPKMMIAALCVGSVITKVIANDDFGIESASPVAIANPVNPQPGMQFSGYKTKKIYWNNEWLQAPSKAKSLPATILSIPRTNSPRELAEIYTAADIFFNPTYEDTFPTVNLEARACKTRVVTYDTGGCKETLDGNDIVIPKGDLSAFVKRILSE